MRIVLLALTALALLPGSAFAVESEGTGEGIKYLSNLPLNPDPESDSEGTDLEFATLTVAGPAAPSNPATPGTPAAPAAPKATAKKKAKPKTPASCKKAKKAKSKKARARYAKACKKAKRKQALARKRAKARKADARPGEPGIQKTFAFVGSYKSGLTIFDITNDAAPTKVSRFDCSIAQGDVQVFQRPDLGGRWFATFTHDDGYAMDPDSLCVKQAVALGFKPEGGTGGTFILEVTDPKNVRTVSFVPIEQGSHNLTAHPSGKWLYNSNSDLITSPTPALELVDITDVSKPKPAIEFALQTFPGLGTESHDITFNKDGTRAYVAALSHAEILDTTDPGAPKRLGTVLDPVINVWHQSDPITIDGKEFLIVEDEFAGATGTGQCPNGGVHAYDVTNPAVPIKVGYWNITDTGPTDDGVGRCTAHVFDLHEEAKLMTIAYYNGGVRVVDLSSLTGVAFGSTGVGMKQVGWYRFTDSDTWAVKAPAERVKREGFVMYGDDHRRGFDTYRFEGVDAAKRQAVDPGRWYTPTEAAERMERLRDRGQVTFNGLCFIGGANAERLQRIQK